MEAETWRKRRSVDIPALARHLRSALVTSLRLEEPESRVAVFIDPDPMPMLEAVGTFRARGLEEAEVGLRVYWDPQMPVPYQVAALEHYAEILVDTALKGLADSGFADYARSAKVLAQLALASHLADHMTGRVRIGGFAEAEK